MKKLKVLPILALLLISVQANAQSNKPAKDRKEKKVIVKKTKTVKLKITGMTCVGCSNHISKALSEVEGVIDYEVKYPENTANIEFDDSKTNIKNIIQVIEKAGYKTEKI